MTVDELRKKLAKIPGDMPVVMSIDPEGNKFHELEEITKEKCADLDTYPAQLDAKKCVCLWP